MTKVVLIKGAEQSEVGGNTGVAACVVGKAHSRRLNTEWQIILLML